MKGILQEFRLKNKEVIIHIELPIPAIHNLIMACLTLAYSPDCSQRHNETLNEIAEYLAATAVEQCPEYEKYLTALRGLTALRATEHNFEDDDEDDED